MMLVNVASLSQKEGQHDEFLWKIGLTVLQTTSHVAATEGTK